MVDTSLSRMFRQTQSRRQRSLLRSSKGVAQRAADEWAVCARGGGEGVLCYVKGWARLVFPFGGGGGGGATGALCPVFLFSSFLGHVAPQSRFHFTSCFRVQTSRFRFRLHSTAFTPYDLIFSFSRFLSVPASYPFSLLFGFFSLFSLICSNSLGYRPHYSTLPPASLFPPSYSHHYDGIGPKHNSSRRRSIGY